MILIKNKHIKEIPFIKQEIDDISDLPFIPPKPLPVKSFAMYIVGQPGSGKTTFWNSLLVSHPTKKKPFNPKFYYKFFDKIFCISNSLQTLNLKLLKLNPDRLYNKFSDDILEDIIESEAEGENLNNLILLDDCIRDLSKSKILCKLILNRRHCCQNPDEENKAGLSVIINSQKYNMLPLMLRCNMSDVVLYRTENQKEVKAVISELMADMDEKKAKEVLEFAWEGSHNFLLIKATKPKAERYYKNFDLIQFE